MKGKVVKATRVLVLEGDEDWINRTLEKSYVQVGSPIRFGDNSITEVNRTIHVKFPEDTKFEGKVNLVHPDYYPQ